LRVLVPETNIPVASVGNVRFVATVAFKRLRVEVTFPISGDVDVLEPTRGGHQIARVVPIAVASALRTALSPGRSKELIELFTHHGFDHDPNGTLSQGTQVLMEFFLWRQYRGR
jgi:hypothetical protein